MKQILQDLKTGETFLEELPIPQLGERSVLIKTHCSLVSLGTEKMLVEFGRASLIEKARKQPDKVLQVLDKLKTDGILPTLQAVFNKLGEPIPLGYCNAGRVIAIGREVTEFSVGERVASNGPHAEIISVPVNLVSKIPDTVTDEEATFTVIGSIGLQSIRLLKPTIGETIVVFGLGLIGLITCQLLKANGCKVIGIDLNKKKCEIARKLGFIAINPRNSDSVKSVIDLTDQIGADGVLITASSKSSDIIAESAQMSRKKGRIILVGVVGLSINRSDFYEKELSFQVSCSYGPGRYDNTYEKKGLDYPLPFVRWTENRNFEAMLELIRNGSIQTKDLITQKYLLNEYNKIYANIDSANSIAALLIYPDLSKNRLDQYTITLNQSSSQEHKRIIGIIGAGNFTRSTLLPILKNIDVEIKYIASSGGLSGTQLAKKYRIKKTTTDYTELLNDKEVDTIIIATPHNSHAKLVIESISSGKDTFVEKPLALNNKELKEIQKIVKKNASSELLIGFNRRFSPHIFKIKETLGDNIENINIIATMNAGFLPLDHWTQDLNLGGGRIIGEACHLIDLCVFLSGSLITSVCMNNLGKKSDLKTDNASILLRFESGSNAVINYFSNGSKKYSKERVEVFSLERTWVLDNYRKTEAFGVKGFKLLKTKQDKGHRNQFENFLNNTGTRKHLISPEEIFNVTKASFAAIESMKLKQWIEIK